MSTPTLRVAVDGPLTVLLLDRPRKAHAYDRATLDALGDAIARLATPVVVVGSTGGGAFCGGADLDEMAHADPLSALDLRSQAVFDALARTPRVTIAAVQGAAVAGGCELALACDLRVAGPKARFSLPETGLGIVPSAGGCTRLPRLIGAPRAKEVILGGRVVDADTALAWGLVNRLADDPLAEARAWALDIARRDPLASRLAKAAIDGVDGLGVERLSEALLYGRRVDKMSARSTTEDADG
ncbi:MAG: enoyl-CoA hydratase/isomerase family protein [Alphaproteobacteria bacterium]|nr:enoyl-CoA hydratase/isomerase family protein [Alphaproteobacteria bacterium]